MLPTLILKLPTDETWLNKLINTCYGVSSCNDSEEVDEVVEDEFTNSGYDISYV
jgi:hypothetical protein